MSYRVCVVSGSRAEYDLLRPVITRLIQETEVECDVVITGSHLGELFGNTQNYIMNDGIPIAAKIEIPLDFDGKADMARSTGATVIAFADYFETHSYDMLVLLGDRFEIYGAAIAASMIGIPIAHLFGGDTTEGAVDEFIRHGITKMSYLHFSSCEEYRRRVIQLGENPNRVFNVGSLGVENCLQLPLLSFEALQKELNFSMDIGRYAVVTFHPVTLENATMQQQMNELIKAMNSFGDFKYIVTKSNADAGGRLINDIWEHEAEKHDNWLLASSLGAVKYISALKYSAFMLGNSSSGISEAPSMKIPTVNIGDRQKGRVMADSLICCEPNCEDIVMAMTKAVSPEFKEIANKTISPFGDGNTSEKMVTEIMRALRQGNINIKKAFYDIAY